MSETITGKQRTGRRGVGSPVSLPQPVGELGGQATLRNGVEVLAVIELQIAIGDVTQIVRLLQDGVEHRHKVARRGVDDLKQFSGRGLLFQCLALFSQQPRVLDCDHCLGGEVLQQRDLLAGECAHLLAVETEEADGRLVSEKRYMENCACAPQIGEGAGTGFSTLVRNSLRDIHHLGWPPCFQGPRRATGQHWRERSSRTILRKRWGNAASCNRTHLLAVETPQHPECRPAQPHRLFEHRVEHRHQVAGRRIDDLQYLCCRGLLFQ